MEHADDRPAGAGLRIARNAVTLTVCRVGADALGLLLFVSISRSLGPAGTGAYSYAFAVATLIFFLTSLGVDTYGVREFVRLPAQRRQAFLAELLGTQLLIILAALCGLVVYLAIIRASADTLAIVASLTAFQLANAFSQTLFVPAMAAQRFNQSAIPLFIGRSLAFVPTAILVQFAHIPLTHAVLAFPVAGLLLLAMAIHRANRDGVSLRPFISRRSAMRVGASLWAFASAEVISQAFPRIGLIVAGTYLGHAPAGMYATGMKLLELTCVPVLFLGIAAFPRLSHLHDTRFPAFQQFAVQLLWVLVLTSGAVGWFMYFIAPHLIVPLLGRAFAGTEHLVELMGLVGIVQAAETVLWPLLLASGQQIARLQFAAVALTCNVVLSIALAPVLGLEGIVWASAVSYLFMALLFLGVLRGVLPGEQLLCLTAGFVAATGGASLVAVLTDLAQWTTTSQALSVASVFLLIVGIFYVVSRYMSEIDGRAKRPNLSHIASPLVPHRPAALRYALLCNGGPWPEWQQRSVDELIEAAGGEPTFVVVCKAGSHHELALPCDFEPSSIQLVRDDKLDELVEQLRTRNLDFVVCLTDAAIGRACATSARYGVWAFHIGDWVKYRGDKPAFWEVYAGEPVSTAMLVRLLEDENAAIPLKQATLRTKRHSYRANLKQLEARCTQWLAQVVREIQAGAIASFDAKPLVSTAARRKQPSVWESCVYLVRAIRWTWLEFLRSMFVSEQWNVGIVDRPIHTFLSGEALSRVKWLPKLRAREFVADPFGVVLDGKLTILCEHFDYATGLGRLIAIDPEQPEARTLMKIGPQPPVHLSYPYVMELDGELLCIPESVKAREVALYRCERFPDQWRRVATLIANMDLVDVTVFRHEERWWLAGSDAGPAGASSELHLWYAERLTGPWHPHLSNPVKIDVCSARPGGTMFRHEDALYRPAQDCSTCYGRRVVINRIVKLSPTEYEEEFVQAVEPAQDGPYRAGLHTLSAVGNLTLIDSKRSVFAKEELPRAIGRLVAMVVGRSGSSTRRTAGPSAHTAGSRPSPG